MQIRVNKAVGDGLKIRLFEGVADVAQPLFRAEKNEVWWNSPREIWLGLGNDPSVFSVLKSVRTLFHKRKGQWPDEVNIDATGLSIDKIEAVINGAILGGYNLQLYKTSPKPVSGLFGEKGVINLISELDGYELAAGIERAHETAVTQMAVMDLMNAPGNKKTPEILGEWALQSGRRFGYKVTVLGKEELAAMGMQALLAVNKGSAEPPVLILTEYVPDKYEKTIALVGKGVTFDTGGISIKDSANMHLMKSDMGGAGAVLGIVELAAKLKLPVRLIGVVPSTENSVDGASTRPGDVIGSYSGRTIEVIDTDAEGRLILADALSYAVKNYHPDILIDLATLTGSVIQTLGYQAAGLFSNDEELVQDLIRSGQRTGEKLWRLPIWDDYKEEIESDIADVKNYHGKPLAGAIVAAKFLEVFTEQHSRWAHLDIAGMAFGDTEFAPGRAGTAFGVRLLSEFLRSGLRNGSI